MNAQDSKGFGAPCILLSALNPEVRYRRKAAQGRLETNTHQCHVTRPAEIKKKKRDSSAVHTHRSSVWDCKTERNGYRRFPLAHSKQTLRTRYRGIKLSTISWRTDEITVNGDTSGDKVYPYRPVHTRGATAWDNYIFNFFLACWVVSTLSSSRMNVSNDSSRPS